MASVSASFTAGALARLPAMEPEVSLQKAIRFAVVRLLLPVGCCRHRRLRTDRQGEHLAKMLGR